MFERELASFGVDNRIKWHHISKDGILLEMFVQGADMPKYTGHTPALGGMCS